MKNYSLHNALLYEVYAGQSLTSTGRAMGGGAAQYIVEALCLGNLKKNGAKKISTKTAGVSSHAADVALNFTIGKKKYKIDLEVKFGGGTFDLASILKANGKTLKKNTSVGRAASKKAMIDKLKRDQYIIVVEGGGTKSKPSLGMGKMRVIRVSDANKPAPAILDKYLFGQAVKSKTCADIEAIASNSDGKARKKSTRTERSITFSGVGNISTELDISGAMSAEAAHAKFIHAFLQQNASAVKYRRALVKELKSLSKNKIDCTEDSLLALMAACDSKGSSAFATCWNQSKGVYLPVIPDISKSKYKTWVKAVAADWKKFEGLFKKCTGKGWTKNTKSSTVIGKGTGKATHSSYNEPDTTDKALSKKKGKKSAKKSAKNKLLKDFTSLGEMGSLDDYLVLGKTKVSKLKQLIADYNRDKPQSQKITGHRQYFKAGLSAQEILSKFSRVQRAGLVALAEQLLDETSEEKTEPIVKVKKSASKKSKKKTLDHLSLMRSSKMYKSKSNQKAAFAAAGKRDLRYLNPKTTKGTDRIRGLKGYSSSSPGDWSEDRFAPLTTRFDKMYKDWKKVIPTPLSLAKRAGNPREIELEDIYDLLKREGAMRKRKYSIISELYDNTSIVGDDFTSQMQDFETGEEINVPDTMHTEETGLVDQGNPQLDTETEDFMEPEAVQVDDLNVVMDVLDDEFFEDTIESLGDEAQIDLGIQSIIDDNESIEVGDELESVLKMILDMPDDASFYERDVELEDSGFGDEEENIDMDDPSGFEMYG